MQTEEATTATADPEVAAAEPTPPAPPAPEFRVYPQPDDGCYRLNVVAENAPAKVAVFEAQRGGPVGCEEYLRAARDAFFRSGEGAELVERSGQVADLEQRFKAAQKQVAELRREWEAAIPTGSDDELAAVESLIGEEERKLRRIEVRLGNARTELGKLRGEVEPKLRAAVLGARAEFLAAAKADAAARSEELRVTVVPAFLEWLAAASREGAAVSAHLEGYWAGLFRLPD
jgi:hypothetical protein